MFRTDLFKLQNRGQLCSKFKESFLNLVRHSHLKILKFIAVIAREDMAVRAFLLQDRGGSPLKETITKNKSRSSRNGFEASA